MTPANKKPKILIIEDEQYLLDIYKMKFQQENFDLIIADNGPKGYKLAKSKLPDLILLDIVMPKIDGYEILKKLKKDPKVKKIPVVLFSNLGQKEEIKKGMALGATDYIIKSDLTPSALVHKIHTILNKKGKKLDVQKKYNMLMIEDDEAILDMYAIKFQEGNFKLEIAKNGAWGLRLAKEKKFDVILMDLVMPAMHGLDALEKIRSHPTNKNTPIVVFSNSAQESDIKKAKKKGANEYYVKSQVTPQIVYKRVKELLENKD